jgi:hypothetical protein
MFFKDIGQLEREKPLLEVRSPLIIRSLNFMKYDAANVGWMDLLMPEEMLKSSSAQAEFPFLSANVRSASGERPFKPYAIREFEGFRVGVFGLVSSSPPGAGQGTSSFRVLDPVSEARKVVRELQRSCDLIVALTSLGQEDDRELARSVSGIDTILGGLSKKVMYQEEIVEGTIVLQAGSKGMRLGILEITFLPGGEGRWVRRDKAPQESAKTFKWTPQALHKDISDHPVITGFLEEYRRELKEKNIAGKIAPPPASAAPYVGAEACRRCHPREGAEWEASPHAGAFATLVRKGQEGNPDCLGCHVTAFRRPGGYAPGVKTPDLSAVQCEACHGEGRSHRGPGMIDLPVPVGICRGCHNMENSPTFEYEEYLKRLGAHTEGYFSRPPALR